MTRKRDIYLAIMKAAHAGTAVRLSAAECGELAMDDAIATRAGNALEESEHIDGFKWANIDPYKKRDPANQCVRNIGEHDPHVDGEKKELP